MARQELGYLQKRQLCNSNIRQDGFILIFALNICDKLLLRYMFVMQNKKMVN